MRQYSVAYNYDELPIHLPDHWQVRTVRQTGKPLTQDQVKTAIGSPVGCRRVKDMVTTGDTVAIIMEDHTRRTPIAGVMRLLLDELTMAGVRESDIVVVGATAAHRKMDQHDFVAKLGSEITNRVRVQSHDPFGPVAFVGTTSRGTPVWINETVVRAKVKIGVGGIAPHGSVGFGGGAKLVLPGISGYSTIAHNHTRIDQSVCIGTAADRPMRLDVEEAAKLLGLDFIVVGLLDMTGNLVGLVAGDQLEAHHRAIKKAKEIYQVTVAPQADLVIACSFPFETDFFQAGKGLFPAMPFVKQGGVVVWMCGCPEGVGRHLLVQQDGAYRSGLLSAFKSACDKATVVFTSDNLNYAEIEDYLPRDILFARDPLDAIARTATLVPDDAKVTILYSSPLTIGVD